MNFAEIVLESGVDYRGELESRACPDQFVGQVNDNRVAGRLTMRQPALERPSQPAVVLVLESPHVREFANEVGPAQGTTGTNIARYLEMVPGLGAAGSHGLILVNAIQFQCSLGCATKLHRDRIFLTAWRRGGRDDLCERIQRIYRSGDTLVCACTKGGGGRGAELRRLVYQALSEVFPSVDILRRCHPATWNIPNSRKHDWGLA